MSTSDHNTVHVVDDEAEVRRSLSILLKSLQFRPVMWDDGASFVANLNEIEPGCVLLDLRMAGMDGPCVQKRVADRRSSFPLIMMTGHGDAQMEARALKEGARDFLHKPFTRVELQSALMGAKQWIIDPQEPLRARERARSKLAGLDECEAALLKIFARGQSERWASHLLKLNLDQVEICREMIFMKLQVGRMAQAVRAYYESI